jgi:hypothetical protein
MGPGARIVGGLIAISAIVGIGIEFRGSLALTQSPFASLWVLVGYFTILTNGLVAVLFASVALGWKPAPRLLAGAALAMALVGIIYALLLSGLRVLEGQALFADFLLHTANPILVALFWLAFAEKGRLTMTDAFFWATYPLAYCVYALLRGAASGFYPYPFLDVGERGMAAVLVTAVIIAAAFIACGLGLVLLDRWLARR